ncbi:three-helix bundle dimerization domain-containing protein [Blastococcus sp. SYSU D01042]
MTLTVPSSCPEPSAEISCTEPADPAVEQAVDRLRGEYAGRVRPQLVVRVVRESRRDLGGSPIGAMPELVERLARYRLDSRIG